MNLVSFVFPIFFFCILFLYNIFYHLFDGKFQWLILLVGSYIFYAWANPFLLSCIIISTAITWLCALISKKRCIISAIVFHLIVLGILKYSNFVIDTINIFGTNISHINPIILPLGISFYTFQNIGYLIDVKREICKPERNFLKYALFASYFPHISQGPIGRFDFVAPQLFEKHPKNSENIKNGFYRILLGYFEKLVIAGRLAPYVTTVLQCPSNYSGLTLAITIFFYSIYLYADFSGYMNIVLGCSNCLGIKLNENFDTPYFSSSISEYWRRWHITLGTWFKDYLYYPLLRSQIITKINKSLVKKGHKSAGKNITVSLALLIVWFMTGLWHGAAWHYIVWGLWHGLFIIFSIIFAKKFVLLKKILNISESSNFYHCFKILRTYCIVLFGYIFFAANSLTDSIFIIRNIFTNFHISISSISEALLPFIPGNIAVSYAIIAIFYIIVFFFYDYFKKKQFSTLCKYIWNAFMISSIILFGYFGNSNFVYIQF